MLIEFSQGGLNYTYDTDAKMLRSENSAVIDNPLVNELIRQLYIAKVDAFIDGCIACTHALKKNGYKDASSFLSDSSRSFLWRGEAEKKYV